VSIFSFTEISSGRKRIASAKKEKSSFQDEGKKRKIPGDRNFCYECHMGLKRKLKRPCIQWKKSVHVQDGTQCNLCHGGNPNLFDAKQAKSAKYNYIGKPEKKDMGAFCGREECHSDAYSQFQKSVHIEIARKKGKPNCTTCHGVHNIKRSSKEAMSVKTCFECHSKKFATEIIGEVFEIEKDIKKVQNNINFLTEKNVDVREITSKLDETKDIFFQLVHVFSKDLMVFSRKIINLELQNLQKEVDKQVAMLRRIDLLYKLTFISILSIIFIFIIYYFRNITRRRRRNKEKAAAQ